MNSPKEQAAHTARPTLWAVADLHAAVRANLARLDDIHPRHPDDWLIVAGDVAERFSVIRSVLTKLRERFSTVIWVPGNHELFSRSADAYQGREKYDALVELCRDIDILTPEDPFVSFGDTTIVPLFTLYDYSFRPAGTTVEEAVQAARDKAIMMTDEFAIAPFVDIRAWCWDRLAYSIKRLSRIEGPTVLINHWPLAQEPTLKMTIPEIALWCGTRHTRQWPQRYQSKAVVYGHLHMPSEFVLDDIPHFEVSLGYPREWRSHGDQRPWPYPVLELAADGARAETIAPDRVDGFRESATGGSDE